MVSRLYEIARALLLVWAGRVADFLGSRVAALFLISFTFSSNTAHLAAQGSDGCSRMARNVLNALDTPGTKY